MTPYICLVSCSISLSPPSTTYKYQSHPPIPRQAKPNNIPELDCQSTNNYGNHSTSLECKPNFSLAFTFLDSFLFANFFLSSCFFLLVPKESCFLIWPENFCLWQIGNSHWLSLYSIRADVLCRNIYLPFVSENEDFKSKVAFNTAMV